MPIFRPWRHGSRAGYGSGVAGVDARRATPPDPRPPRWGRAGCCQLDPSHPTLVTCAVGREGRHAPRPNDVGGQPRFPGARKGMTLPLLVIFGLATGPPAGVGDGLRFIPLHALTTLLSALGAFCLWEFRVSQQISTFYGPSVQAMEIRLSAGSDGGPRRFTAVVPTPHAYSGQWPVKTKRARARSCASVVTRKRPSLNRAPFSGGGWTAASFGQSTPWCESPLTSRSAVK